MSTLTPEQEEERARYLGGDIRVIAYYEYPSAEYTTISVAIFPKDETFMPSGRWAFAQQDRWKSLVPTEVADSVLGPLGLATNLEAPMRRAPEKNVFSGLICSADDARALARSRRLLVGLR